MRTKRLESISTTKDKIAIESLATASWGLPDETPWWLVLLLDARVVDEIAREGGCRQAASELGRRGDAGNSKDHSNGSPIQQVRYSTVSVNVPVDVLIRFANIKTVNVFAGVL